MKRKRRVRAELGSWQAELLPARREAEGLVRAGDARPPPKQWLLLKHKDRFAGTTDLSLRQDSVLTGRDARRRGAQPTAGRDWTRARLAPTGPAEKMPAKLAPMLAEAGEQSRTETGWLYEPKLDGYRVLAFVRDGKVSLQSRRGLDYTSFFPEDRRRPGRTGRRHAGAGWRDRRARH